MLIRKPNGEMTEVKTACDFNPRCKDCLHYMNDCNGDVDHDPALLEDCDIKDTPWGQDE